MLYLDADIEFCRKNDKWGLYNKADEGKLKYVPGVDMEFEVPPKAELIIKGEEEEKVEKVLEFLAGAKIYPVE